MKVRAVLIGKDKEYGDRLSKVITRRYANRVQLSFFTDTETAMKKVDDIRADMLVVEDGISINAETLPVRCLLVYMTNTSGIREIGGHPVIGKYQSARAIINAMTELFVLRAEEKGVRFEQEPAQAKRIVTFFPGAGGVGCSTMAAAYALRLAAQQERVLYLNLEECSSSDCFFSGENKETFSDVLYALEMNHVATAVKIQNAISRDSGGVLFFAGCPTALDMRDVTVEKIELLFEQLQRLELFDWIIVDMAFAFDNRALQQLLRSDAVVFVSDGGEIANYKLKKISDSLEILIRQQPELGEIRTLLMYNKFSSQSGKKAEGVIFLEVGGVGRFVTMEGKLLLRAVTEKAAEAFDEIL